MGKLLGQTSADINHELGRIAPQRLREPLDERNRQQADPRSRNRTPAPSRKRGPSAADLEFMRKAGRYGNKIGLYMQKLAPLQSHPSAEIRQKAAALRSQFTSKRQQLQQQTKQKLSR